MISEQGFACFVWHSSYFDLRRVDLLAQALNGLADIGAAEVSGRVVLEREVHPDILGRHGEQRVVEDLALAVLDVAKEVEDGFAPFVFEELLAVGERDGRQGMICGMKPPRSLKVAARTASAPGQGLLLFFRQRQDNLSSGKK